MAEAVQILEELAVNAFKDTVWATIRYALVKAIPGADLVLPQDLVFDPLTQARLNIGPGADLINFFTTIFKEGGYIWNAAFVPLSALISTTISNQFPTLQQITDAIKVEFALANIDTTKVTAAVTDVIKTTLPGAIQSYFAGSNFDPTTIVSQVNNYTQFWASDLEQKLNKLSDNVTYFHGLDSGEMVNIFNLTGAALNYMSGVLKPKIDQLTSLLTGGTLDALQNISTQVTDLSVTIKAKVDDSLKNILPDLKSSVADLVKTQTLDVQSLITQSFTSVTSLVQSTLTQLGELEYFISTEFKFWVGEAAEYIINSLKTPTAEIAAIGAAVGGLGTAIASQFASESIERTSQYTDMVTRMENCCFMTNQNIGAIGGNIWPQFEAIVAAPASVSSLAMIAGIGGAIGVGAAVGLGGINFNLQGLIDGAGDIFNKIFGQAFAWLYDKKSFLGLQGFDPITQIMKSILGLGGGFGLAMLMGELVHPLKQLGMGRMAAYFWDMADFKAIGGDVMKLLNRSSTLLPLEYGLSEFFRPRMPNTDEARKWFYWDKTKETYLRQAYRVHGFSDEYITNFMNTIWEVPSQRVVLNMIETPGVDTEWIRNVLRRHGMDEGDVEIMIDYARRKRLNDEFAELVSAYETAFIAGYVDVQEFVQTLTDVGRSEHEVQWKVWAANRKEQTQRLKEDIDIVVSGFRADNLTQQEFEDSIFALPLVPAKAQNLIEKELARKRSTAKAQRAAKQAKLSVAEILKGYDYQMLNDDQALARLVQLNYTPEDSILILTIHKGELAAKQANADAKAQADAEADAIKTEISLANEWARFLVAAITFREISADNAKALIADLPLSDARKALYYKEADLNASRPAKTGAADKPKTLREADVYKALNYSLITYEQAVAYLTEKGYTPEETALLLQLNSPTQVPGYQPP